MNASFSNPAGFNQNHVELSGSALRQFYGSNSNEDRMSAYSRFAQSCQVVADQTGMSFLEASQFIHRAYNL